MVYSLHWHFQIALKASGFTQSTNKLHSGFVLSLQHAISVFSLQVAVDHSRHWELTWAFNNCWNIFYWRWSTVWRRLLKIIKRMLPCFPQWRGYLCPTQFRLPFWWILGSQGWVGTLGLESGLWLFAAWSFVQEEAMQCVHALQHTL